MMTAEYISPLVEVTTIKFEDTLLLSSLELDYSSDVWTGAFDAEKFDMQ